MLSRRRIALLLVSLGIGHRALAQMGEISNWIVSPYRPSEISAGLSTMTDISPGTAFVGMQPCRLVDTRPSQGFTGQWGPPIMAANAVRTFDLNSAPHCPGIPANVEAYSLNFTVTETAGQPGDIRAWPTGIPPVTMTSVLNWNFVGAAAIANSIIIPAGTGGQVDVLVAGFSTHLVIDINGYFTNELNPNVSFGTISTTAVPAILGANTSATPGVGVLGSSVNGIGVLGHGSATGVVNFGVWGETDSSAAGAIGVLGFADNPSGQTYGMWGQTDSSAFGSAGVFGVDGGYVTADHGSHPSSGIRGESRFGNGVLGATESGVGGVRGVNVDSTGLDIASGFLGRDSYGVFAFGPYGGTGAKYFVEPHPFKADTVIRYVSLEGNESGTYFRGRGRFQNGLATIEVPEDFRLVTDRENLSIQVTPIGEMATVAVQSIGLERIVVRGSRNVEFYYLVNGVRKTHKHLTPIGSGREYMPERPDARMPLYLTEGQKKMLISNGTYNADGTVNMETARRLGWDRLWDERSRPESRPTD